MSNYRYTFIGPKEINFADPNDPRTTLRFTVSQRAKNAGTRKVTNNNVSVKSTTFASVPLANGGDAINCSVDFERIVANTDISGSLENKVLVAKIVNRHIRHLQAYLDDLVLGFKPGPDAIFATDLTVPAE